MTPQPHPTPRRRRSPAPRIAAAALLAASIVALGIVGSRDHGDTSAAQTPTTTTTTTTTTMPQPTTTVAVDGGPTSASAQARVEWFVAQLDAPTLDPDVVAAGLAPDLLAAVPLGDLLAEVGRRLGAGTGWEITDLSWPAPGVALVAITSAEGIERHVALTIELGGDHLIAGIEFVATLPDGIPAEGSLDPAAFDAALGSLAPEVSFGLYDTTDGDCRPVHSVGAETAAPVGSAFKLWILAALAEEIEAGRASWDETMPVTAADLSSPSGEIWDTPIGTPVTLRHYAELMISISDNSATDHLLDRLGRERVEATMRAIGVADPERNIPLLSTRELFLIKRGRTLDIDTYLALGPDERRAALDTTLAGVALLDDLPADVDDTAPVALDTVEWFATPLDMCRTHLRLAELATHPGLEPIADILRMNPGAPFASIWTDVRFKGGAEAGVAYAAWRVTRDDGRTYVLAGGVADPTAAVDTSTVVATVAAGIRLLDAP